MSYDIYLKNEKGEYLKVDKPHMLRGGTYAMGGTQNCWLNITYNYAPHYYRVFGEKGIRTIYGMKAEDSIPALQEAADTLLIHEISGATG